MGEPEAIHIVVYTDSGVILIMLSRGAVAKTSPRGEHNMEHAVVQ